MRKNKDDVLSGVLVQVGQQLLNAEPEDHSQPCIVWLQKDEDGMELPDMGDVTKDAVKVLLVLVNPARISNSRSINEVDHPVLKNKVVGCRLLSCRLAGSKVLVFIWPPNVDVLALPGVCGEGKLRWDGSNDLRTKEQKKELQ